MELRFGHSSWTQLADQRIDVGEVEFQGENIDVEVQHMPRRKYQLKVREDVTLRVLISFSGNDSPRTGVSAIRT